MLNLKHFERSMWFELSGTLQAVTTMIASNVNVFRAFIECQGLCFVSLILFNSHK